jgi:biopolymer transport protein TolQ
MKLNALKLIIDAGPIVKLVLLILASMSVVAWGIILQKARLLRRSIRSSEKFIEFFWAQKNMEAAYRKAESLSTAPVAAVFKAGYMELINAPESKKAKDLKLSNEEISGILVSVERALRRSSTIQTTFLEKRIPFLATTGSAAPFIGLFGTVWGIMNSFLNIGASGATNLAVVAPGISEALIATAIGLIAAIPAVIGYNFCVSKIRILTREMENFSNDFLNIIKRQLGAN